MTTERTRLGPRITTLLLVGALVARVVFLGRDDLWSDEVHTFQALARDSGDVVRERLAAGHFPLYFLLLKAWSTVAGTSQFALRLPSALIGTLAVLPAVALFGRLLPPRGALWASILFAFHPILLELSREARMYSLLVLCFVTALEAVVAARDEGRLPVRFWAALAVGTFVHATWGFGLAAMGVWLWLERRLGDGERTRAGTRAMIGVACGAVVLVGALAFLAPQQQELVRREHWWEEAGVFLVRLVAGAGVTRAHVALYGAFAVVWAWVAFEGWRVLDPRARRLALLLAIGVPLASLGAWLVAGVPWGPVRYVAVATVGIALVGGAGAAHPKGPGWILAGLLLAVIGLRFVPVRTHWSLVAETLAQVPDPVGVIRTPDRPTATVLSHYLRREGGGVDNVYAEFIPDGTTGYWCACWRAGDQSPHWEEIPPDAQRPPRGE